MSVVEPNGNKAAELGEIARYESYIQDDLNELKDSVSRLVPSRARAYKYAKTLKIWLIVLGLLVGIIGIVVTAADTLKISDTIKAWFSFVSGLLGFIITFTTTNFDPVKFRQRTIDLGQVITEFKDAIKNFDGDFQQYHAMEQPAQKLEKLIELEKNVEKKKHELMLKARLLKTSL